MPIDLPPQPLCLLWREGHALTSGEVCSSIEGVYGDTRLGFLLLIAGGGPFLFGIIWGHDGGQRTVGKRSKGRWYLRVWVDYIFPGKKKTRV